MEAAENEKAPLDPARPLSRGSSSGGSSDGKGGYSQHHNPPPQMYQQAPGSSYGTPYYNQNNNNNNNSGYGGHELYSSAAMPPSSAMSSLPFSSSRSWGSQPPLTSSKRDQNWEKKRRQWLARKNGGRSAGYSTSSSSSGCGGNGLGMMNLPHTPNPWDDDHHAQAGVHAPPSPLSKFVHQQSQKQFGHGYGNAGGHADYERIGTAQSHMPPPTASAYPQHDYYNHANNQGCGQAPPSRSGVNLPSSAGRGLYSGGAGSMSHVPQAPTEYGGTYGSYGGGYDATPATRGGALTTAGGHHGGWGSATSSSSAAAAPAGMANSNMGTRNIPTAAASNATSRAGSRQPPGGNSNWSPFS